MGRFELITEAGAFFLVALLAATVAFFRTKVMYITGMVVRTIDSGFFGKFAAVPLDKPFDLIRYGRRIFTD